MRHLWAPWRLKYIRGKKEGGCIFCKRLRRRRDRADLILHRDKNCFVILNRFPYNSGHLMVVPNRHTGRFETLTNEEGKGLFRLVRYSVKALRRLYKAEGFNVGMNVGQAAGAGITGHLHLHVVPRWRCDTNFMPVLAATRGVPEYLDETFLRLKKVWRVR